MTNPKDKTAHGNNILFLLCSVLILGYYQVMLMTFGTFRYKLLFSFSLFLLLFLLIFACQLSFKKKLVSRNMINTIDKSCTGNNILFSLIQF